MPDYAVDCCAICKYGKTLSASNVQCRFRPPSVQVIFYPALAPSSLPAAQNVKTYFAECATTDWCGAFARDPSKTVV